ncbi:MAG TPA: hypothetical protein P5056_02730 [Candidatus Paceibacterota bacterium]|nr:hypothetical protein [Candidatus Paceibacterota bacterium]
MPFAVSAIGALFLLIGTYFKVISSTWVIVYFVGLLFVGIGFYINRRDDCVPVPVHVHEQEEIDFSKLLDEMQEEFRQLGIKSDKN